MGYLLSKVIIDGITIHDDTAGTPNYLVNWEYERTGTNQISQIDVNVLKSINDIISLSLGQTVQIWKGFTTSTDTKVFDGFISEFEPDGGLVKITAKDKLWDLIRRNVNKVYESSGPQAGQISAIATDLIETHGGLTADVVATGTETTETVDEFRCVHTDVFERLKALATAVRYQFWYDAINDTVHFEPEGYNDSEATLTVGTDIIGIPKWSNDTSRMVNDLRVDGAVSLTQIRKPIGSGDATIGTTADFTADYILLDKTPESVELIVAGDVKEGGTKDASSGHYYYIDKENKKIMPKTGTTFPTSTSHVSYSWNAPAPIHQINQESIDSYGKFEKQITVSDITTIADAEVRTVEILSKFSQPFLVGELFVKSDSTIDVNFGDTVTIVDSVSSPNINQSLVVTKQLIKYPGTYQELTVGDEAIKLADWQINVESRLSRIEESLSLSNQDLILELVDIQNTGQSVVPRYRQVLTRDTSSDYLWGVAPWTWGTGLWQDTYTESEIDNFIQQYENEYTEEFTDDDFEDTSGTGTWLTGTMLTGETLISSSIDFNNGTVNNALPTFTGSGAGTPTFYLMADGTNWETVTSGTLKTFTNSGTDLRWKVLSTGGTYVLTEVEVKNYH